MNKTEVINIIVGLFDDVFIKIFRKNEQRNKIIEKKEKLAGVEEKFEKKGVQCPDCDSFQCIKKWN